MKKSTILTVLSILVAVPLLFLLDSIKENKAVQAEINSTPVIDEFETRSAEWGKYFPRQYSSFTRTKKSDGIHDLLEEYPALVVLWSGYGFSKDYNAPRGHFYALESNINTLRTGAPVDDKTGPMPTACWTCKSPDVPRQIKQHGELAYFTGKWARLGDEMANPVGCADCHDNETMKLEVNRDYLKRALDIEGSKPFADATHQDMRSLVCAQCHSEYYFKATKWTDSDGNEQTAKVVTFPWDDGLSAEDMERYYDNRSFVDWTHKLSQTPMLKAQHPGYETFKTGVHGKNNIACADCHMPYVREGGVKYSDHQIRSPLDNIANTCLNCHKGTETEFRGTVARKLERKNELHTIAMDVLAKAHLEAAKALELGATPEEMKPAQTDIRHGQWRWDYSIAAHGSFFHAPEETLRVLGSAINKGHDARLKLRIILAKYGAADYEAPDFSTKEKAQVVTGLPYDELVTGKEKFLEGLRKDWIEGQKEKGLFDPGTREGLVHKTSYSDKEPSSN